MFLKLETLRESVVYVLYSVEVRIRVCLTGSEYDPLKEPNSVLKLTIRIRIRLNFDP